jgi:5'(3')-deoxyribonucleotidase
MPEQKRKVRLMLDLDGIVYRWSDTTRYIITSEYPEIVLGESISWNYIKDELIRQGRPEVWGWVWDVGVTKHGMFRYGSLYKGSREALRRMNESGKVDNVVVTSRPETAVLDTEEWISYQRIPHLRMHILSAKESKAKWVRYEELDAAIDDGEHNIEDILEHSDAKLVMLWDRPWNQTFSSKSPRFVRVSSWKDVEAQLYALYETINA